MQIHIRLPFAQYGEINITGNTLEELFPSLDALASRGIIPVPNPRPVSETLEATTGETAPTEITQAEAPAPEKPKATRKPKVEKEAPVKEETPKLTIADVTDAVTRLANAKGVSIARGLIQEFGVGKASEIKAADFAAFISKAKELTSAEVEEDLPL